MSASLVFRLNGKDIGAYEPQLNKLVLHEYLFEVEWTHEDLEAFATWLIHVSGRMRLNKG